jgi:hypothetical protein
MQPMATTSNDAHMIQGVVPVIPIPFHADDEIDERSLRPLTLTPSAAVLRHAEFLIDHLLRMLEREGVAVVS